MMADVDVINVRDYDEESDANFDEIDALETNVSLLKLKKRPKWP